MRDENLLNPFRFGSLAIGDTFTNREDEIRGLRADVLNGQDVVIFAPRRYGKSSLVSHVANKLRNEDVLIAQVNLMTTPTKTRFAEKLAKTIYEEIATPLFRAKERLRVFSGLRISPVVTMNPEDGSLGFSFDGGWQSEDVDATLERLLELFGQLGEKRKRRVALVLDEFQEVMEIDANLPKLMRSIFQEQPHVAHIYLGSRRHMMTNIFDNENEPFWRSAKHVELEKISEGAFCSYIEMQFRKTDREIDQVESKRLVSITGGHPYATQELAYFTWEETSPGDPVSAEQIDAGLTQVLRSEYAHFSLIWEKAATTQKLLLQALGNEPTKTMGREYRQRHNLPATSSVQKALTVLIRDELVSKDSDGIYKIVEPFLAEWLAREL